MCWVFNESCILNIQVKLPNTLHIPPIQPWPQKNWVFFHQFSVGVPYLRLCQIVIIIHHLFKNQTPLIYFLLMLKIYLPPPPLFSSHNFLGTFDNPLIYLSFMCTGISCIVFQEWRRPPLLRCEIPPRYNDQKGSRNGGLRNGSANTFQINWQVALMCIEYCQVLNTPCML